MENKLMTIMFLDMKGYTQRSATQTIDEMKLFHDQMFAFVNDHIKKWDGIMVKTMGDGFMVRFESPTNAVQAGLEVQKRLDARNAQMMNPESIVRFRIGINTGEVGIDENGDLFGDPVNIAARIQTFADPNDVFIAESTYLAMNRNEFGSVDLGSQELKNATREIKIYKVLKNGSPGVTLPSSKQQSTELNNESRNKYLAIASIGITLLLIIALAFFIGLRKGKLRNQAGIQKTQLAQQVPTTQKPLTSKQKPDFKQPSSTPVINVKPISTKKIEAKSRKPKTLLDFPVNTKFFKFNKHEQEIFSSLQYLRKQKKYSIAINKAKMAVKRVKLQKKIIFSIVTGQLFWESGKKEIANSIFNKLLKTRRIAPEAKRKVRDAINAIKSS